MCVVCARFGGRFAFFALAFARAQKNGTIRNTVSRYISFAQHNHIRATACAERGDSKGAESLCPWRSSGDRGMQAFLGKSLRLFHLDEFCLSRARKKNNSFVIQFPTITPPLQSNIKFRATACAERGDSKGAKPLCPWKGSGKPWAVSRRLFRHLWRDKWRISRGCKAKLRTTNKERSFGICLSKRLRRETETQKAPLLRG